MILKKNLLGQSYFCIRKCKYTAMCTILNSEQWNKCARRDV